ncbi:mediator complex subunit MED14 [Diplocarpon rosae]|nr:mediator complex subunit MED14 [Diplocarpon rosae]
MPGVIMDHGSRNGSHTNHDRDQRQNGANGVSRAAEKMQDKGKPRAEPLQSMTPTSPIIPEGLNRNTTGPPRHENGANGTLRNLQTQMGQLPPEITHIADGYMPLSALLIRLAQKSHADLLGAMGDLAQMPTPAATINGSASHYSLTEDASQENVRKKLRLLNFATTTHESWTKALVITGWSRKSEEVSKLVDLRIHLEAQKLLYTEAIDSMANNKRAIHNFRLPNPDFRTALEVLTTGTASWMPDLNYIQPRPLTAKEVLRSLEKLNTLLSIRLNLDDYDSIPLQFRDFTIQSGRATFRVPGEFEIDLTIADEEPGSQYWFIDLRFLFRPSSSKMTAGIRWHLENKVNEVLLKDGLKGCYKYLHELILTYKIAEFRRQGDELARSIWIDTLKVEILNRPICIQYWIDRYSGRLLDGRPSNVKPSKSWIILGVHSGRRNDGRPDANATSRLFIRWFRESKEVMDEDIWFDDVKISTESLLKTVIAKHISHILTSMYEKLLAKPLYAKRELEISLKPSSDDPADLEINIQLTNEHRLSIKIDPVSGRFVFGPISRIYSHYEGLLNSVCQDPAADGHTAIERLRSALLTDAIQIHASSLSWYRVNNPGLTQDSLNQFVPKESLATIWFRRPGWVKDWYLAVTQSMSGEKWHLIKTAIKPTPVKSNAIGLGCLLELPIKGASPSTTYSFLSTLNIFAAGMLSHYTTARTLHSRRVHYVLGKGKLARSMTLPAIYAKLSELIPSKNRLPRTGRNWARDVIKIYFHGVEVIAQRSKDQAELGPSQSTLVSQVSAPNLQSSSALDSQKAFELDERSVLVIEVRMVMPIPQALSSINEQLDKNIVFDAKTGSLAFRLQSKVGESFVPELIERIVGVERLVEFVQVLHLHEVTLKCETVSLGKLVFTYPNNHFVANPDVMDTENISPTYKATINFSVADNIMALVLESGNPHLRIADHLTKVLNGPEGLGGIATLLPLTLPVLRGLDAVETAWYSDGIFDKGEVVVNVRATDVYRLRYEIHLKSPLTADTSTITRKVGFEIKLRSRKAEAWWYVQRVGSSRQKGLDALDDALKSVWDMSGPDWRGMRVCAVAKSNGIEMLLVKLDEVMRNFVLSGKGLDSPLAAPPGSAPAPPKQALNPRMQQQQRQQQRHQQPPTNHNQSQGRNNTHNNQSREIVEID